MKAQEMTRGIPYTVSELALAAEQPPDIYHRELMQWAARRILELEAQVAYLEVVASNLETEADRGDSN